VVEVIESPTEHGVTFYRLACPKGVLKNCFLRNELIHEILADPVTYGLENVLQEWRTLPNKLSIREASAFYSSVGGS
jgi:hypothetical protein